MTDDNNYTNTFEELCVGYVLNVLDPEEREKFEAMFEEATDEQQKLFLSLHSAASQLAHAVERGEPSNAIKQRLLAYLRSRDKEDASSGVILAEPKGAKNGDSTTSFAVAVSFALLFISLSLLFYAFNLTRQVGENEQTIESRQAQITTLQNEVQLKEELLSILGSREVNMVLLAGMEASPDGYGKIIWNPENNRALLQVSNLPAVSADQNYQLWIIKDNQSVSAGVFAVHDPGKDTFVRIEQMDSAEDPSANAFAVTLESKGGVPQPTGDMYLMGRMDD